MNSEIKSQSLTEAATEIDEIIGETRIVRLLDQLRDKNKQAVSAICSIYERLLKDELRSLSDGPFVSSLSGTLPNDVAQTYRADLERALQNQLQLLSESDASFTFEYARNMFAFHNAIDKFKKPKDPHRGKLSYWLKRPHWTLDEAVAISCGHAPGHVSGYFKLTDDAQTVFSLEIIERRSLAKEWHDAGKLKDPILPAEFLDWAIYQGFDLPEKIVDAIKQHRPEIFNLTTKLKEAETALNLATQRIEKLEGKRTSTTSYAKVDEPDEALNPKERTALYKILLGIALKQFGYDPKDEKSEVPSKILKLVHDADLHTGVDTILKHLREGHKHLCEKGEFKAKGQNRISG